MPAQLTMPQLSDTMTEGTLVKWNKKEGDAVKAGEEVADVETDKATMPMESFEGGTLAIQVVKEGGKVVVGGVVGIIALKGEDAAKIKASYTPGGSIAAPVASAAAPVANAVAAPAATTAAPNVAAPSVAAHTTAAPATAAPVPTAPAASDTRLIASPLAKRIAADQGINLANLTGSGPNGRIVQKDVLEFAEKKAAAPVAQPATQQIASSSAPAASKAAPKVELPARVASGSVEKIELSKRRQVIAQRLVQSKQTIPHFYETIDIDMTAAVELRKKLLAAYEKTEGVRVSIGDVIAKAVAAALKIVPQLNSTFDGTTITRHGDVHLGMAVALPDGLIVPVLRNIDQMGIKEIRVRSADIVDRARAQRLKKDELSGATFTVSNLGTMGIREFSAIVNPPEVGILAIGASEDRAVVRNCTIVIRTMMTVSLSADHRVIDGAVAASYLQTLKNLLEEPAMMLA